MPESPHKIVAKSDEVAQFKCGHAGPTHFVHVLFGHEYEVKPEFLKDRVKCSQCMLDEQAPTMTQCVRCKRPIFKSQACIMYSSADEFGPAGLCCLSAKCGIGPIGGLPGKWDGEQFIDGFKTGSIRMFSLEFASTPNGPKAKVTPVE